MFTYTSINSFNNEQSIPMTLCEWNLPQYQLDYVLLEADVKYNSTSNIISKNTHNNCVNSNSSSDISTFSSSNAAYANSNTISYSTVPLFVAENPLTTITACVAVNNSLSHSRNHSKPSHQELNNIISTYCASNGCTVINNEDQRQPLEVQQQQEHCQQVEHRECLQNEEEMPKGDYYSHASVDAASTVGLTPSLSCLQLNNSTCCSATSVQPRLCSATREYASQERKSVETSAGCQRQQNFLQTHDKEELPSSRELCCEPEPNNNNYTCHTESVKNANCDADITDYTAQNNNNYYYSSNSDKCASVTNNSEEQKLQCNNIRYDPNAQSLITQPAQLSNYLTVNVVTDGKVYLLPAQETEAFIAENTLPSQVETQVHYNIEPYINCVSDAYNPTPLYNSCNFESTNWLIPCEYTSHSLAHSMQPYNTCACEYMTMESNAQYNISQTFPYNTESPSLCEMNNFSGINNQININSNVNSNMYAISEANCNSYATAVTNYNPAYDKSLLVEDSNYNDLHVLSDEKWSELLKLKGVRWHYDPYQINLLNDDDNSNQFYSKETQPKITEYVHDCQNYNMNKNHIYSYNSVRNNSTNNDRQSYPYNYNEFIKVDEREANKMQRNSPAPRESESKASTTNTALRNANDTSAVCEQETEEWSESAKRNNNANLKEQLWVNNEMRITESKQMEQCELYTEQQEQDVDRAPIQEQISENKKTPDEEPELHNCHCRCGRRLSSSNHDSYCNKKEERLLEQCTTHTPHQDEINNQLASSFATSMSTQCSPSGVTDTLADTPSSRRFPINKTRLRYRVLPPSSTPLSENKHTPSRPRRDRAQCKKLHDATIKSVELFSSKWSSFEPYRDDKTDAVNGYLHQNAHLQEYKEEQQYRDDGDDDDDDGIKKEGKGIEHFSETGRCGQDDWEEKDDTIDHAGLVRTPPAEETLPESNRNNCNNCTIHDSSNEYKNHHCNWRANRKYTGAINNKLRRVWLRDAQLQELHDLWYNACKTCRFDKEEKEKYHCVNKGNTSNNNNNNSSNDDDNITNEYGEHNNHNQNYFSEPYSKYWQESSTCGGYKSFLHHHQQGHYTQTKFVIQPNLQWEEVVCMPFKYLYVLRHHHRRSFAVSDNLFSTNTLVVVDGDRGVEMGVIDAVYSQSVLCKMTRYELKESGLLEQNINTSIRVYREASEDELAFYVNTLPYLEACTLNFLYQLQHASYFIHCAIDAMEFIACEFQADCQKLYVYYRSHVKVRILELATFLYQIYPCRIWIEDVGKVAAENKHSLEHDEYVVKTRRS